MNLVIVESPAKSKTIGKYLGSDFRIIASFGHIRDLPSKNGSVKPEDNFVMHYELSSPQAKKFIQEAKKLCKTVSTIYLATDPDREGEAISWHVITALQEEKAIKKSTIIKRVVFNEITKRAVTAAIKEGRDIDMNLVNSQQARRALDYLVGFNLSPILWRKLPGSKSAGRVQSVSLRLICERESEIEKFTKREFWSLEAVFKSKEGKTFPATLTHFQNKKLSKFDITSSEQANSINKEVSGKEFYISSVEKKQTKRNPYPPFITSTLQQEASRKLGFGAKKTMQIAQKLYEGIDLSGSTVGLITYMRTDGTYLAQEAVSSTREFIKDHYGSRYLPKSPRTFQAKSKNAQEAHEAIRPTDINNSPQSIKQHLTAEQFKLYEIIWKRMIACQMSQALIDQVSVLISATDNAAMFSAHGSTTNFDGFYKVYKEDHDDTPSEDHNTDTADEKKLPPLSENEVTNIQKLKNSQHFTQPPSRYTEAGLVKKMEELGIGRPSTYATIISVLQDREYVVLKSKRFLPEWKGRIVTSFLSNFFTKYVEYDFTSRLEEDLDKVARGEEEWLQLLNDFWKPFSSQIQEVSKCEISNVIKNLSTSLEHALFFNRETDAISKKCPQCTKDSLILKLGKFGAFLGCSNYPDCNYIKNISTHSDTQNVESSNNNVQSTNDEYPKVLGTHPAEQLEISLRKGPYGIYIQMGESKTDNIKRSSLPPSINPEAINIDIALKILALPRNLGVHPETKKDIKVGLGKFGPYILHDNKYTSLKNPEDDILVINLERAIQILSMQKKSTKKSAEPLKILGKHPEYGTLELHDGFYGPYIKATKAKVKNASIPKNILPNDLSLEDAINLINKKNSK